jgi:hypothetical protein
MPLMMALASQPALCFFNPQRVPFKRSSILCPGPSAGGSGVNSLTARGERHISQRAASQRRRGFGDLRLVSPCQGPRGIPSITAGDDGPGNPPFCLCATRRVQRSGTIHLSLLTKPSPAGSMLPPVGLGLRRVARLHGSALGHRPVDPYFDVFGVRNL